MPLEAATYISDLVAANPASSDGLNQADDHLRLIKAALKATFPYAGTLHSSDGASLSPDGTSANPTYSFYNEPGLGFYRAGAATMAYTGILLGGVPIGSFIDHGGATAPQGYLACDGQAVSRTAYAQLFAAIGTIWGAGDGSTTFNVPTLISRYRRHRDNSTLAGAVGNTQSPQNLSHTHTGSGTTSAVSNDHTHSFSGTTGNDSPDHTHGYNSPTVTSATGGGSFAINVGGGGGTTGGASTRHQHAFSGTTGGISANHTHTYGFTTSGGSADGSEARPYSATVLTCIRAF